MAKEISSRFEWEQLHGKILGTPIEGFIGYGWYWQPKQCKCQRPHHLAQDKHTKIGKQKNKNLGG